MQRLLEGHHPAWKSLGLQFAIVFLTFAVWLPPTTAGTDPQRRLNKPALELPDSSQTTKVAPRLRKISARKLPLEILEEFRKDYPAAVELEWQSRNVLESEVLGFSQTSTSESLLVLRLDSKIYRVQGYNLGQYFTATYRNNIRQNYAVLESCENLATVPKSSLQSNYPGWNCLAFTQISTNGKISQHRILATQSDQRQTQIFVVDTDGKVLTVESLKQWKRMPYKRLKNESRRLQLLTTSP